MFVWDLAFLIKLTGFGGFLWLGLFIVSRATRQTTLTIVSFFGLLTMAVFLFSSAIIGNNTTGVGLQGGILLTRFFWWANLLPTALWLHMTLLISRQLNQPPRLQPPQKSSNQYWLVIPAYLLAIIFSLVGSFSDLFLDYSHSVALPGDHFYTDVGSWYIVIILYLLLINGWSLYNLLKTLFVARQRLAVSNPGLVNQLGLLVAGGLLFMVGGGWLSVNFYFKFGFNDLWGNLFLLTGLVLIGYGIVNFSLLVEGQNVQRDFFYSFTLNLLVCLVYLTALTLSGANSSLNALVVVGLAVISHTVFDFFRGAWDKLFFSRREQVARSEARAYATAIASQPTPTQELAQGLALPESAPTPRLAGKNEFEAGIFDDSTGTGSGPAEGGATGYDQKKFKDYVRKALTDLKNPSRMITSPLLSLKTIELRLQESELEDNRLNRVTILREWLIQLIDNLRPAGADVSKTGDAWRFYNVLYYPYVREISRKGALIELRRLQDERRRSTGRGAPGEFEQILEWLVEVDEDTFYKWQRRASDTIGSIISEQESKLTASALKNS